MATVFVFGSNKQGIHGAGAALHAKLKYGAKIGIGVGRTGNAYAIPTKNKPTRDKRQLSLEEIFGYVKDFLEYAKENPDDIFQVTAVGCGLAGYIPEEIAPLFVGSPSNVQFLEENFNQILKSCE